MAVEGDADVLGVHAAEAGAARFGFDVVEIDAGQIFQEFADVAVGDVAENIGRDRGGDVHVAALFHDGLGVALAFGGDGEGLERDDAVFARGGVAAALVRLISRTAVWPAATVKVSVAVLYPVNVTVTEAGPAGTLAKTKVPSFSE
jgi:hypothetical protein